MMPLILSQQSPAKLNLSLRLLHQRKDGFTELHSLAARLNSADALTLTCTLDAPPAPLHFTCSHPTLCEEQDNLVVKAYRLFTAALETPLPAVALHLEKKLPAQAGLGGGSSNAAHTLLLLNDLLQHLGDAGLPADAPLSPDALALLASQLGSDVNLFLDASSPLLLMTGRGERILPLPAEAAQAALAGTAVLLVKPHASAVSTIEAYQQIRQSKTYSASEGQEQQIALYDALLEGQPLSDLAPLLINDFEPSVYASHGELKVLVAQLKQLGAFKVLLCGSGACIAALFSLEAFKGFQNPSKKQPSLARLFPPQTHFCEWTFFEGQRDLLYI